MQIRPILLRIGTGIVLGTLAGGPLAGGNHSLLQGGSSLSISRALADTSTCHRFSPTYRRDGDGPGATKIGAISTQISVTLPSYICTDQLVNNGAEYFWNGIQASGQCPGLVQSGWFTTPDSNNNATPARYFVAEFDAYYGFNSTTCASSVYFGNGLSGYPTFKTTIHATDHTNCPNQSVGDFYINGTLYNALCADWGGGGGSQVVNTQEQFWSETRVPGVTYRSMTWCQSYGASVYSACSPNLALYTNCTGYRGCIATGGFYNDWACFGRQQYQGGGYQGFNVWDQRSVNGGQSC